MSLIRFTSELSQKSKRSKSSSRSWSVAFLGVLNVLTALLNFWGVGWALARGLLEFAMRHVGFCGVRHGGCVWDGDGDGAAGRQPLPLILNETAAATYNPCSVTNANTNRQRKANTSNTHKCIF